LTTAFGALYDHLNFERLIRLVALRELLELHELLRWFSSVPSGPPVFQRSSLPGDIQVTEDGRLLVVSRKHLIKLVVIHISSLFILFFLIGL
jgi:hypothetical protein